ncbi:unnamed protein product, partial [Cochlearia groenlandica]
IYSTVYTQCVRILDACLLLFVFFWDGLLSRFQFIVPLLKLNKSSKVVFYCYFPDLLPAKRKTTLRRLYRKPIDFIEEHTTGGYDERLKENVEYLEELRSLAEKEGVSEESKLHHILFNRSKNRTSLKLRGGPVETVKNGVTGYLFEPTPEDFSTAMARFMENPELANEMGTEARKHVVESFSVKTVGQKLNQYLLDVVTISLKED